MKTPLLLGLGALLLVSAAAADREHDRDRDRDNRHAGGRIILYEKVGFRGDSLVIYPGDRIENFSEQTFENGTRLHRAVSSIRVEGDVEIVAYEKAGFKGDALRVIESTRDLTGRPFLGSVAQTWNDRIASLRVERTRGRDRDREPGHGRPRVDPEKVVKDTFTGYLGREPRPDEARDFRSRIADQGWTAQMLAEHLRNDAHYRTEAAEAIVRRAYRDVLERDVDPAGLKQYTAVVLRRGWTESDVRDDLRKSAEYRKKVKR
jgi:hypothetical protein